MSFSIPGSIRIPREVQAARHNAIDLLNNCNNGNTDAIFWRACSSVKKDRLMSKAVDNVCLELVTNTVPDPASLAQRIFFHLHFLIQTASSNSSPTGSPPSLTMLPPPGSWEGSVHAPFGGPFRSGVPISSPHTQIHHQTYQGLQPHSFGDAPTSASMTHMTTYPDTRFELRPGTSVPAAPGYYGTPGPMYGHSTPRYVPGPLYGHSTPQYVPGPMYPPGSGHGTPGSQGSSQGSLFNGDPPF